MAVQTIRVRAGSGYDILIGAGLLAKAGELAKSRVGDGARKAAVITDSVVAGFYGRPVCQDLEASGLEAPLFVFPAGEPSKNHGTLLSIYSFLAKEQLSRSDLIVALGGGVCGDMAGFAAATYLRGIRFMQIPTTLLAQIDSSVGGKTGVDLREGKNLVGAFYPPSLVLCDPSALKTLGSADLHSGMAEAVKYGCILDAGLFDRIAGCGNIADIADAMITRCIELKRDLVEEDEFDRGSRALLNFGHTLGHAIEKATGYARYTHGQAVAIGMVLAARAGEKHGLTAQGTASRIAAVLRKFDLPVSCGLDPKMLATCAANDKKRQGSDMNLILLLEIGKGFIHKIPVASLDSFFFGGYNQ